MLADVVGASVALPVVPVIISELGEDGHMRLIQRQAVLAVEVVWLTVSPVKPVHSLVHVLPDPVTGGPLAVSLLKILANNNFQT